MIIVVVKITIIIMIKKMEKTYQGHDRFNFCLPFAQFITSTHRVVLSNFLAFVEIFE